MQLYQVDAAFLKNYITDSFLYAARRSAPWCDEAWKVCLKQIVGYLGAYWGLRVIDIETPRGQVCGDLRYAYRS